VDFCVYSNIRDKRVVTRGKQISVCLFGVHAIRVDGDPYHLSISGTTERLFQYLLVNSGMEARREFLAELFWRRSSPERQRSALNSAIWRIKQQLVEVDGIDIVCNGSTVFLNIASHVHIDAQNLTDIVHSLTQSESIDESVVDDLFAALNECDAPFMEGVTSDWVLTERERLFNITIRGMTILMHWAGEQRRYEDALEVGRRLLAKDPFREAAQCEVMWLYVLNGQRAQAIRQYKDYCALLKNELDIDPMPETLALYKHIRQDLNCAAQQVKARQTSAVETPFLPARLNSLLGAIERSRRDLYRTIRTQMG
jgi:DNA-binding SARP family transcriptional activator